MLSENQIVDLIQSLAETRPVFHSEADFQHELAWLIRMRFPAINVRLERPMPNVGEVDILLHRNGVEFLIELKYKTLAWAGEFGGEMFSLRSHGADQANRYAGIKDISRIEISQKHGCAIFLTNLPRYWSVNPQGNDEQFSIADGRNVVPGMLNWNNNQNDGIQLLGTYHFHWRDYSRLDADNLFRYLLVMVRP